MIYYKGTGQDFLTPFENEWPKLWESRVNRPVCLLTTCSHAKPYSKSYIHTEIRKTILGLRDAALIDIVHVSSAGLIPSECDDVYPFNSYDWNDLEANSEQLMDYARVVPGRLAKWRELTDYQAIFSYFNPDDWNNVLVGLTLPEVIHVPVTRDTDSWHSQPDVDNCLTHSSNLESLTQSLNEYFGRVDSD